MFILKRRVIATKKAMLGDIRPYADVIYVANYGTRLCKSIFLKDMSSLMFIAYEHYIAKSIIINGFGADEVDLLPRIN